MSPSFSLDVLYINVSLDFKNIFQGNIIDSFILPLIGSENRTQVRFLGNGKGSTSMVPF